VRVALVKQVLDVFGPWSGVKWRDTSPVRLFEVWPNKAVYWELTCMLEADWYVIPQTSRGDYTRVAVETFPGRAEAIRKYTTNITPVEEIPFEQYDLVISFDAILDVAQGRGPLFAYFAQEHWDKLYTQSLERPAPGYDLFLAHMMDSSSSVSSLPQSISFPYLHDASLVRSTFPAQRQEAVWVEWRTLMTLAMRDSSEPWSEVGDAAAGRLKDILDLPICYRSRLHEQTYGFADPPNWGDAARYLQALAGCKYFVSVGGRIGGGQGLAEAAAAGCLCIGQDDRPYHRLICHPSCLCTDMAEMPSRLRILRGSRDLQREVLAYQDENLDHDFRKNPLNLLAKAIGLKIRPRRNGQNT
jgi:hypothetical protein